MTKSSISDIEVIPDGATARSDGTTVGEPSSCGRCAAFVSRRGRGSA